MQFKDVPTTSVPKLELRNISKVYKPKNGVPVHALNNVSIKFPDRGMIFILGKSGSGKSTMLNLIGGLDTPDSGELLIDGKSTKEFKNKDLDSYRNTQVGFVFQEYNVLEEFTIAANIALAIELQGRKATDEQLNQILEEVDLMGFADRKPNELSGGQLQRVAIARALIKNPDIIMADEPTGALDSKTGEQVFNTLKKLSRDKVVIVVSHDREFAEHFGDRVIELADGKIIDDICKTGNEYIPQAAAVSIIGEDIIRVQGGHKLSEEEWQLIRSHIEKSQVDSYISTADSLNQASKDAEKIIPPANSDTFKKTEDADILKNCSIASTTQMIKSKLPFRSAFKLGINGLKYKKIRLATTILTTIISLCMFGLADSMASFDTSTASYNSLKGNDSIVLSVGKQHTLDNDNYSIDVAMGQKDLDSLNEKTSSNFIPAVQVSSLSMCLPSGTVINYNSYYISNNFNFISPINKYTLDDLEYEIVGALPTKGDEIAITKYVYETYEAFGYSYNGKSYNSFSSPEDFISKDTYIVIGYEAYKVTGIIDTQFDSERYVPLKTTEEFTNDLYSLSTELNNMRSSSPHIVYYISTEQFNELTKQEEFSPLDYFSLSIKRPVGNYNTIYSYALDTELSESKKLFSNGKTSLAENEFLVGIEDIHNLLENQSIQYRERYDERWNELYSQYREIDEYNANAQATSATIEEIVLPLIAELPEYTFEMRRTFPYSGTKEFTGKVVGVALTHGTTLVMNPDFFNSLNINIGNINFAFGKVAGNPRLQALIDFAADENYSIYNPIVMKIEDLGMTFSMLGRIFLYCGIGAILISALLLMNFIATSVALKRKEIGILRAVGARSNDVFLIFFSESAVIALMNFVLGILCAGLAIFAVNIAIGNSFNMKLTILDFGIRQISIMFAANAVSAFIGSFLPVYKTAKQKPIDAIRKH